MATKYSKIKRSINEFKSFLDYHREEYKDAYIHIKPSEGWNIPYHSQELYQIVSDLYHNLYEGIYPKLLDDNPATDEEIINSFKGLLKFFTKSTSIFDEIIKSRKKDNEEPVLWTVEGIIYELLIKVVFKLKEVIKLAEEDLIRTEAINENDTSFLIGIITATTKEFEAVKKLLTNANILPTKPDDSQIYYEGYFQNEHKKLKVILTKTHHQGISAATNTTTKLIINFKPKIIAMIGHAAGNKNLYDKLNIGDILICSSSVDYEQVTYYETKKAQEIKTKSRQIPIASDPTITNLLDNFSTASELEKIKNEFDISGKIKEPLNKKVGLLISGNALARSEKWFDKIVSDNTGTIGLDMETYGVYYACKHTLFKNKPLFISIKSVSDFGSHKSNYPDVFKDDNVRVDYAIHTSSKLFYYFALEHFPI